MTVTTTPRLGLTRWSDGDDPFIREQMDGSHEALEDKTTVFLQGLVGDLPAASALTKGFLYWATDTDELYYGTGAAWVLLPAGADDPVAVGTAIAEGVSPAFARADHVHELGAASIDGLDKFAATLRPLVICTSGTRPGAPVVGQPIWEADTNTFLIWDGTEWIKPAPPAGTWYETNAQATGNIGFGTTILTLVIPEQPVDSLCVLSGQFLFSLTAGTDITSVTAQIKHGVTVLRNGPSTVIEERPVGTTHGLRVDDAVFEIPAETEETFTLVGLKLDVSGVTTATIIDDANRAQYAFLRGHISPLANFMDLG